MYSGICTGFYGLWFWPGSLSAIKMDGADFVLAFSGVLVRSDISGLPVNPDALIYYSSGAMAALHFRKTVEAAESRKRCVFDFSVWGGRGYLLCRALAGPYSVLLSCAGCAR